MRYFQIRGHLGLNDHGVRVADFEVTPIEIDHNLSDRDNQPHVVIDLGSVGYRRDRQVFGREQLVIRPIGVAARMGIGPSELNVGFNAGGFMMGAMEFASREVQVTVLEYFRVHAGYQSDIEVDPENGIRIGAAFDFSIGEAFVLGDTAEFGRSLDISEAESSPVTQQISMGVQTGWVFGQSRNSTLAGYLFVSARGIGVDVFDEADELPTVIQGEGRVGVQIEF